MARLKSSWLRADPGKTTDKFHSQNRVDVGTPQVSASFHSHCGRVCDLDENDCSLIAMLKVDDRSARFLTTNADRCVLGARLLRRQWPGL